jgi:hypothetical protein
MPLTPVPEYDGARYPTLDDAAAERRAFLRQVGLSAIAAALGGAAVGCTAEGNGSGAAGSGQGGAAPRRSPSSPATPPIMPAGTPAPPRWPGTRGALIGGRSIEVTYADGSQGWVAVAAVFPADNRALEEALIDAETAIAGAVRLLLKAEQPGFSDDARAVARVEAALLAAIAKLVSVTGLQSVTVAKVNAGAARAALAVRAHPAPAATVPPAPAPAAPAAPMAMPTSLPPEPRRLPRAGGKCPLHGSGCAESEHGG